MTHQSLGNEVVQGGIVHRCSCGWVSRPCFSNMIASIQGQDHRENAAGSAGVPVAHKPHVGDMLCKGDYCTPGVTDKGHETFPAQTPTGKDQ